MKAWNEDLLDDRQGENLAGAMKFELEDSPSGRASCGTRAKGSCTLPFFAHALRTASLRTKAKAACYSRRLPQRKKFVRDRSSPLTASEAVVRTSATRAIASI